MARVIVATGRLLVTGIPVLTTGNGNRNRLIGECVVYVPLPVWGAAAPATNRLRTFPISTKLFPQNYHLGGTDYPL